VRHFVSDGPVPNRSGPDRFKIFQDRFGTGPDREQVYLKFLHSGFILYSPNGHYFHHYEQAHRVAPLTQCHHQGLLSYYNRKTTLHYWKISIRAWLYMTEIHPKNAYIIHITSLV